MSKDNQQSEENILENENNYFPIRNTIFEYDSPENSSNTNLNNTSFTLTNHYKSIKITEDKSISTNEIQSDSKSDFLNPFQNKLKKKRSKIFWMKKIYCWK